MSDEQKIIAGEVELVCDTKAPLGEGPLWDARIGRLVWVDILGNAIHLYDPDKPGQYETIPVGSSVSAIVPRAEGGYVVTLEDGFYKFALETHEPTLIVPVEADLPGNRFNDGKVDPVGRFVAGTMTKTDEPWTGNLYSLGADGNVQRLLDHIGCSNGLAWSADGETMYYVDTHTQELAAFDYDLSTGLIANRRVIASIPPTDGYPDGMAIDAEGMIWLAHWDGWRVSRWNPATGELLGILKLPVAKVTSVAFGGPNYEDMYITSARAGISDAELAGQPHAGGLFRARVGVRGLPPQAYKG